MSIFKWISSLFKEKKKPKLNPKPKPKGQELIYWNTFINRKNLKFVIPLISMLLLSSILLISIRPITEKQIYTNNFKYDICGITRGGQHDKIIHSLSMGDHQQSFILLEEAIQKDSTKYVYIFYYSVTAMQLGKHDIAQKYLIKLNNGNNLFVDDAQWFLALSYLKTDKEKAIIEFRKISINKNHYKHEIAKEILNELE